MKSAQPALLTSRSSSLPTAPLLAALLPPDSHAADDVSDTPFINSFYLDKVLIFTAGCCTLCYWQRELALPSNRTVLQSQTGLSYSKFYRRFKLMKRFC